MYEFESPIALYVGGDKFTKFTRYHFSRGVFEQPATFSFTVGSGDLARELLSKFRPLTKVQLKIDDTLLFTGVLEDVSCDNSSGATEITLEGRDMLYRLVKNYVLDEKSYGSATYLELTREVLKRAGYPDNTVVVAGNEDNRVASLRAGVKKKAAVRKMVEQEQTNLVSSSGAKVVYEKVVGRVGESHFDFLVSQLKRAGLYLMCGADGKPILMVPDNNLEPSYALTRYRGVPTTAPGTIMKHAYQNRTSGRHASTICYGKGRPDKNGHRQNGALQVDYEMTQIGFVADNDCFVMHDDDAKDLRSLEYIARRHMADEARRNRTIRYTTPGHVVPGIGLGGKMIPWTPDTIVSVNDQELSWPSLLQSPTTTKTLPILTGIKENCYIERVDFDMDARGGTTSTLTILRWSDLLWLSEDPEIGQTAKIRGSSQVGLGNA